MTEASKINATWKDSDFLVFYFDNTVPVLEELKETLTLKECAVLTNLVGNYVFVV